MRITDITNDGLLKVDNPVSPNTIEPEYFLDFDDFLIARSGSVGRSYLHKQTTIPCQFAGYLIKFPLDKTKLNPNFFSYITKSKQFLDWISRKKKDGTISNINAKEYCQFNFPLPPVDVQQQVVNELEGYQKIIDGCRMVVENYKPTIEIDPSCEMIELGDLCDVVSGYSFDSNDFNNEIGTKVIKITNVGLNSFIETNDFLPSEFVHQHSNFIANTNDIAVALTRPIIDGGIKVCKVPLSYNNSLVNQRVAVIKPRKDLSDFIFLSLSSPQFYNYVEEKSRSLMQPNLSINDLKKYKITVPNEEIIQTVVKLNSEIKKVVEGNKLIMESYTQKIQNRISKVWGD